MWLLFRHTHTHKPSLIKQKKKHHKPNFWIIKSNWMALNETSERFHTHTHTQKCVLYCIHTKRKVMGEKHWKNTYICLRLFIDIGLFIMSFPATSWFFWKKVLENVYMNLIHRVDEVESGVSNTGRITNGESNFFNKDYLTHTHTHTMDFHSPETSSSSLYATFLLPFRHFLYFLGCLYVCIIFIFNGSAPIPIFIVNKKGNVVSAII